MLDEFDYTVDLLNKSSSPVARECLHKIDTGEIHFSPGEVKNKAEVESLYNARLKQVKDLMPGEPVSDQLEMWELAMKELKAMPCHEVSVTTIDTEDKTYLIFVCPGVNKLDAIFFLYRKTTLADREAYARDMKEQGHASSMLIYKRRKRLEN